MPASSFKTRSLIFFGIVAASLSLWILSTTRRSLSAETLQHYTDLSKSYTQEGSLKSTIAVVRYNDERPQRRASLDRYAPFFHTIHHSMPHFHDGEPMEYECHINKDTFPSSIHTYKSNADLMRLILDTNPNITGMLYFHFDAWLDPAGFKDMNYNNVWWPTRRHQRVPSGMAYTDFEPAFGCHVLDAEEKERRVEWPYTWWPFDDNFYQKNFDSFNDVYERTNHGLHKDEFCIGWSDLYYIPRRFFAMYIELANIFIEREAFHEMVVPGIITLLQRVHGEDSLDELVDCWGDCCHKNPTVEAVKSHRCGHRFDWLNAELTFAVLSRLDKQTSELDRGR